MADPATRENAREKLLALGEGIDLAAKFIAPHEDLIRQFQRERQLMESVGPIIAPSLYRSSERVAADAIMAPIYDAALAFLDVYRAQLARATKALAAVKGD